MNDRSIAEIICASVLAAACGSPTEPTPVGPGGEKPQPAM
jgi:hypothetical protein